MPASLYDTRSYSNFDHYVQDLVQFSKVILPATVPRYSKGKVRNLEGGGRDGGGGRDTAAVGTTDSSSSSSLPMDDDCCLESGGGAGDGEQLKLSVVAHSMGGLIAVNAAVGEPPLFEGVRGRKLRRMHVGERELPLENSGRFLAVCVVSPLLAGKSN